MLSMLSAELSSDSEVSPSTLTETGGVNGGVRFTAPPNASKLARTSSLGNPPSSFGASSTFCFFHGGRTVTSGSASSSYGFQWPRGPECVKSAMVDQQHVSLVVIEPVGAFSVHIPSLKSGTMIYSLTVLLLPFQSQFLRLQPWTLSFLASTYPSCVAGSLCG